VCFAGAVIQANLGTGGSIAHYCHAHPGIVKDQGAATQQAATHDAACVLRQAQAAAAAATAAIHQRCDGPESGGPQADLCQLSALRSQAVGGSAADALDDCGAATAAS
jgi:hypothetical protein